MVSANVLDELFLDDDISGTFALDELLADNGERLIHAEDVDDEFLATILAPRNDLKIKGQ